MYMGWRLKLEITPHAMSCKEFFVYRNDTLQSMFFCMELFLLESTSMDIRAM